MDRIVENGIKITNNLTIDTPVFLGPMAGITDLPFREICQELGAGITVTEMVSAKGLIYKNKNTKFLLQTSKKDSPVALQLFGCEPDIMAEAVRIVEDYPFSMIDINMGCPVPKVVKNHEGSAMMLDPKNAMEVVKAMTKATKKPISVKFRKGFNLEDETGVEFAKQMEEAGASLITIHGRTKEQGYSGRADWDHIKKVKESVVIPVIGSGDVFSAIDAVKMFKETGVDGVMVARKARGNPWIFRDIKMCLQMIDDIYNCDISEIEEYSKHLNKVSLNEKKEMILKHAKLLVDFYGEIPAIRKMRSHVAWYVAGEKNSAKLRAKMSNVETLEELKELLKIEKK